MIVIGLSHRTAPIDVRERLALSGDSLSDVVRRIATLDGVGEAMVLSTCNRVEVYACARDRSTSGGNGELSRTVMGLLSEVGGREVVPHLQVAEDRGALLHLFRVAASLDSLVVGEPQILGQLKGAVRIAQELGTLGPRLGAATRTALQLAKRVRTETQIGAGQVSVSSVAVDLAQRIFEDLRGHDALLVGAGEMAEAAATSLARHGARILVVNRSPERAEQLAAAVGGQPRLWEALEQCLLEADIVIASTASKQPIITGRLLQSIRRRRRGRSLFLIDIAVPRNVDPEVNDLDNVYLYDIDDLSHVVAESLDGRAIEARRAEEMVEREALAFEVRLSQEAVKPIIVGLRERTRQVLMGELDKSLRGRLKHLGDNDKQALEAMLNAAVNKLMHAPTVHLKERARAEDTTAAEMLRELFDLGVARDEASRPNPEVTAREELEASDAVEDEPRGERHEKPEDSGEEPVSERRLAVR